MAAGVSTEDEEDNKEEHIQWILGPGRAMVEGSGSSSEGAARAKQGRLVARQGRLELGAGTWRKMEEDRVERDLISTSIL